MTFHRLAVAAAALGLAVTVAAPAAMAAPAATKAQPLGEKSLASVLLADGDTFRVWTSANDKVVRSKRRDSGTGAWGRPQVVLRAKNLFCGGLEARTSAGAVAITAKCDRYSYAEDQAPTHSRALWSADTLTWSSYKLPGEAYEEPGISPNGTNAVWPLHQGYVVRTPEGFSHRRLVAKRQGYGSTAVVDDGARVSFLYTPPAGPSRCMLLALTPASDGTVTRQSVALPGCWEDSNLENLDANTVQVGYSDRVEDTTLVQRANPDAEWAVTLTAPSLAPGLVRYATTGADTRIMAANGLPLLALGSSNGRRWRAQAYDPATQTWGPGRAAYDAGSRRCAWAETWIDPPTAVIAAELRCGKRHVVLTTTDGLTWRALPLGAHALGVSPDGRFVAVPSRTHTSIISPARGVVTLPGGVRGRCDVVMPDGPEAAVLLTARKRHRHWPTVLKTSTPRGWSVLSNTSLPTFRTPCSHAESVLGEVPYRFQLTGRTQGYAVRVLRHGGTWIARRSRY